MIRRLRWKVVWLTMLFVSVVLLAVFVTVFLTTRSSLERSTYELLQQAINGDPNTLRSGTPSCFVADVLASGTVRVSRSNYYQLYDDDDLLAIVQDCLAQQDSYGVLRDYHLRYLRSSEPLGLRIAFTDSTLEQATLASLLMTLGLITLAALAVFFACSYLLSGLITRPVGQAWAEQKRFLSDASHELKTPLTVILSSADLLAQEIGDTQYLDNIRAESRQMRTLVEDMLTLSRAEGLGQQSPMAPLELSDLAMDTVLRFEPVAFEAQRQLRDTIAPDLRVRGSEAQLVRLMGILLDNAIKYAPEDSEILLDLQSEGRNARLLVENGGPAIPPEQLRHLFERFYRVDEARSAGGFGLGLPIAQAITKQHGGTIRCESDSRSTRFLVTLPLLK